MAIMMHGKYRTGSFGLDLAFWNFHTSLCYVKSRQVKAIQIQMICIVLNCTLYIVVKFTCHDTTQDLRLKTSDLRHIVI